MKPLFALLACVVLAGCQSTTPEQAASTDDAKCRSYGAQPGSDIYVQCRMMADQDRVSKQRDRRRRIAAGFADAASSMGSAGNSMKTTYQPYTPTPSRTVTCTSRPAFGAVQTVCQ